MQGPLSLWHIDGNHKLIRYVLKIKMGDSIEEVYCDLAVKLSGNIAAHALVESFFICNDEVKFFPDFITF